MKPSTIKTDKKVWKLWVAGEAPKDIARILRFTNHWRVYECLKRERARQKLQPKITKLNQSR